MAIKKIGFDFDKIFVNYPPIIPELLIEFIYKGRIKLNKEKIVNTSNLRYRIPGYIEQQIRIVSHNQMFRPPIKNNIRYLRIIKKKLPHKLYLISSRFGFLKDQTNKWLDKQKLKKEFNGIHFNFGNIQPHIFKKKTIEKNDITYYVDDDLDLLIYLSKKIRRIHLFWLTNSKKHNYKSLPENIIIIRTIKELYKKYI